MTLKFGLLSSSSKNFHELKTQWAEFDMAGVQSLWLSDHVVKTFEPEGPYRNAWTLLPALALYTDTAMIGALVSNNPLRHPSVFARQVLTLDEISQGRVIVGMGAGWYKPEYEIMGIPFPKNPTRALESALRIVKTLLRNEHIPLLLTYDYLPIKNAIIRPRPIGPCPILVGGWGPKLLKVAAMYADIWNAFGTPEEMRERNKVLDEHLYKMGRPLDSLERTVFFWRGITPVDPWASVQAYDDVIGSYSDCGLTGIIIDAPKPNQMDVFYKCNIKTPLST